ncbi:MAG: dTMP kinase, partial [Deltaproteobacteria bacterium]
GVDDDAAWQWRERYVARALKAVFAGLGGSDDPRAWTLRRAYAARVKEAVDSTIGLASDAAWSLRDEVADLWPSTVVKSIVPLARDARAQRLTRRLLAAYPANVSLLKHVVRFEAVRAGAAALDVVV